MVHHRLVGFLAALPLALGLLVALAVPVTAADIVSRAHAVQALTTLAKPSWTGAYIGVQGGHTSGQVSAVGTPGSASPDGWMGGIRAGFDYQPANSRLVFGILADLNLGDVSGEAKIAGVTVPVSADMSGTLRGRVGYAFDGFMLYGTGGLSATRYDVSMAKLSGETTALGWVAGVGVETKLYQNVSIGAEYLYRGRMSADVCGAPGACAPFRADSHDWLLFANLRF